MKTLSDLRGRQVIRDGKIVGRAVQGCLSDDLRALDGLWTDTGLTGIRFVSAEHVCVLGESAVIVDDKGEHLRMKPKPLMIRAADASGRRIGAVVDALLDETTLTVEALILSKGFWDDLRFGRTSVVRFQNDFTAHRVIVELPDDEKEVKRE